MSVSDTDGRPPGGRPRVFDPDTGETLADGDTVEPSSSSPRPRPPWRLIVAVSGVAILVLGIAIGASLKHRHQRAVRERAIALALTLDDPIVPGRAPEGGEQLQVRIENRSPLPVTLTALTLTGGGTSGRATSLMVLPTERAIDAAVTMPFPCGRPTPSVLQAAATLVTADGSQRTREFPVGFAGRSLGVACANVEIALPQAQILGYTERTGGFDVAVRLIPLPGSASVTTEIALAADPLTVDPPAATSLPLGKPRDVDVVLDVSGACRRGLTAETLPTELTLTSSDQRGGTEMTKVPLPEQLIRRLADGAAACPPVGTEHRPTH